MSNVVRGTDGTMEIKVADVFYPVGCFTNFSLQFTNELILKTDVNAGLFRKRRARLSDSSCSVHGLTTLENDGTIISTMYLLQESVRRSELDLRFTFIDEAGILKQIEGLFIIEDISIENDVSGFSESDANLQGTGGFTISDVEDSPSVSNPLEPYSDWWETTPGGTTITGLGTFGRSFSGLDLLEVDREGVEYEIVTGAPGNREARYNGSSVITFAVPFEVGERVFVMWKGQLL